MGKLSVAKNNSELYELAIKKDVLEKYGMCAYFYDSEYSVELIDWIIYYIEFIINIQLNPAKLSLKLKFSSLSNILLTLEKSMLKRY